MYQFAQGSLYGLTTGSPVQARQFGALQDVGIDFDFTLKPLYGQNQFPLVIARGQGKITAKARLADIRAAVFNDLFFAQTLTTGRSVAAIKEAGTVPTTPFQITVANSATWVEDLGVVFAATGVPLTRVASAPTTGQFSVAAGVYTFAAADVGLGVAIDYRYTVAGGTGSSIAIANPVAGTTPTFQVRFAQKFNGQDWMISFNSCVSGKLAIATKLEDFTIPELDFMVQADAANNIGNAWLSQ